MGSRGNIVLQFPAGRRIYLYTHHRGHEIASILRRALRHVEPGIRLPPPYGMSDPRPCRWDDPPYLARVVFNRMTEGDEQAVTGVGLSVERCFADFDELHVDVARGVVRQVAVRLPGIERVVGEWSFQEFADRAGPREMEPAPLED